MSSDCARPRPNIEPLERRVLLANVLDVAVGDGAARSVSFVDADGTAAAISVRGAAAVIRFTGEGLAQVPGGRETAVTGSGVSVASVTATGTSRRTAVMFIASGGDGGITAGQITADGPLKCVTAPQLILTGALSTGGPVRRLELLSTFGATLSLGPGAGASSVTIHGDATDTDLTSHAPLRRLDLSTWVGTSPRAAIAAPSIRQISADFFRGRVVTGSVGGLDLQHIRDSTFEIAGSLRRFRGVTAVESVVNVGGDIGLVAFFYLVRSRIYAGVQALPPASPVPTSVADFTGNSSIGRVTLTSVDSSGDVVVAARRIGRLNLRSLFFGRSVDVFFVADRIAGGVARVRGDIKDPGSRVRLPALEQDVFELSSVRLEAL